MNEIKTGPSINRHKSKQDYATPPEFIAAVTRRFGPLAFDLAASLENAKAGGFYSIADNSLVQLWHELPGNLWLNPPFNDVAPWAAKCAAEAKRGARILMLTPASIGSNWFAEHVRDNALVFALNGRISFDGKAPFPKDCMLSVFGFGVSGFTVWRWKQ